MDNSKINDSVGNQKSVTFFKSKWFYKISLTLIGVIGGYLYYYFIGCSTGSCPLKSNPWLMMAWGGLMAYLLTDLALSYFKK